MEYPSVVSTTIIWVSRLDHSCVMIVACQDGVMSPPEGKEIIEESVCWSELDQGGGPEIMSTSQD